jgi:hypothetical protein
MATLGDVIKQFADFLLKYFVVLAAAGALAMAIVELVKKLRDAQTRFHARAVTAWFIESPTVTTHEALADLLHLAAGLPPIAATLRASELFVKKGARPGFLWLPSDPGDAAFALELEKMTAVFQDCVDIALTAPTRYPALYEFMTESASPDDRHHWRAAASSAVQPSTAQQMKERAEVYARVRQAAKRKLDAFQMFTDLRWVNKQQLWANVVGTFVLSFAFWMQTPRPNLLLAAGFSVLGGMLAPVAKDVVVALQKVRGA